MKGKRKSGQWKGERKERKIDTPSPDKNFWYFFIRPGTLNIENKTGGFLRNLYKWLYAGYLRKRFSTITEKPFIAYNLWLTIFKTITTNRVRACAACRTDIVPAQSVAASLLYFVVTICVWYVVNKYGVDVFVLMPYRYVPPCSLPCLPDLPALSTSRKRKGYR